MPALKSLLAFSSLLIHLSTAAPAPPNSVQLRIDTSCSDDLSEYVLYTYPENTGKCITIGAPGFPFSATDDSTQCGDYFDGGASYADCNQYPKNAVSVELVGNIQCSFFSSEDCTKGDTTPAFGTLSNANAQGSCQDIPPQFPLSGARKQTASSLVCSTY